MKTLVSVTAALGLLGAIAAANPASAAVGQCFDAYGRPVGPPHNTDNPPYGLICQVYRQGGQCTHVQWQWAQSNCGIGPRGYYNRGHYYDDGYQPRYRPRQYDYDRRHYNRSLTPSERSARQFERNNPGQRYTVHPDSNQLVIPDPGQPNNAR